MVEKEELAVRPGGVCVEGYDAHVEVLWLGSVDGDADGD